MPLFRRKKRDRYYRLPPDVVITPTVAPLSESVSWADEILGIEEAWKVSKGKDVKVCVLDSLIDTNHPDLKDGIDGAQDFTGSGYHRPHPHGSHVGSLGGARAGNNLGIRGIAPLCRLYSAAVLGRDGAGTEDQIAAGFKWGYDKGCWLFGGSFGGASPMPHLDGLVKELRQDAKLLKRPFVVVIAAGNDGGNTNFPARYEWCVPVGAFGKDGKITPFTSRLGRPPVVLAPGVDMLGCLPDGGYGLMTGTSQATPIVWAILALAMSKEATHGSDTELLTTEDAIEHLIKSSTDKVSNGDWRLVNARKALEREDVVPSPVPAWETPWIPIPYTGLDLKARKRAA